MANNSVANVSTGRGVAGGYLFYAEINATNQALIPQLCDFNVALTDAFHNLGYVSSDGIVESESVSTETQNDMNGDPINTSRADRTETEKVTLVEMKSDSLKQQYGGDNVTDADGLITVHHNNAERTHYIYVAELLLKDGRRWRKIIPDGQVTEVGDLTINSTTLVGREVTIATNAYTWTDLGGTTHSDTVIDFIESTETPAPQLSALALSNVTLSPAFAAGTYAYTGTATVASTTVTATAGAGNTVTVRSGANTYQSGSAVPLVVGTNVVEVTVQDDESGAASTYVVTVTKAS